MRELISGVIIAIGLVASGSAAAQSAYGYVGSPSAPYLGYVGGGGGPYVPNYGQFVVGLPAQPVTIVHRTQTIVVAQVNAAPADGQRLARRCGPVVLTLPNGPFEPFSACSSAGAAGRAAQRGGGARIIRID